jgi:lipoprotein-anchoring transpeptidase ErfK/SrfK
MSTKLKRHQKALIAAAVMLTAALLLATGVWAYDNAQKDQIAPGVTVGGVEIGGRSVDDARQVINEQVVAPLTKPVVVNYGGDRYRLTPRQLHTTADVDGMLDEAIDKSREGSLFERVSRYVKGSTVNADITPRVSYSQHAVDDFIADLAGRIDREAQNASIAPNGDRLEPTPGKPGVKLRQDEMRALVISEVETPGGGHKLSARVDKTRPEVTTKELASKYPTYILINRNEFKLLFFRSLKLAKTYPIAVGQVGLETPSGLYAIQDKQVDPVWHVPDSAWAGDLAGQDIPPGPADPLKARWMGIFDGAGIHGTDDIGSLGSAASHGCVRMSIPDVIDLYDRVDVGTPFYVQ